MTSLLCLASDRHLSSPPSRNPVRRIRRATPHPTFPETLEEASPLGFFFKVQGPEDGGVSKPTKFLGHQKLRLWKRKLLVFSEGFLVLDWAASWKLSTQGRWKLWWGLTPKDEAEKTSRWGSALPPGWRKRWSFWESRPQKRPETLIISCQKNKKFHLPALCSEDLLLHLRSCKPTANQPAAGPWFNQPPPVRLL